MKYQYQTRMAIFHLFLQIIKGAIITNVTRMELSMRKLKIIYGKNHLIKIEVINIYRNVISQNIINMKYEINVLQAIEEQKLIHKILHSNVK